MKISLLAKILVSALSKGFFCGMMMGNFLKEMEKTQFFLDGGNFLQNHKIDFCGDFEVRRVFLAEAPKGEEKIPTQEELSKQVKEKFDAIQKIHAEIGGTLNNLKTSVEDQIARLKGTESPTTETATEHQKLTEYIQSLEIGNDKNLESSVLKHKKDLPLSTILELQIIAPNIFKKIHRPIILGYLNVDARVADIKFLENVNSKKGDFSNATIYDVEKAILQVEETGGEGFSANGKIDSSPEMTAFQKLLPEILNQKGKENRLEKQDGKQDIFKVVHETGYLDSNEASVGKKFEVNFANAKLEHEVGMAEILPPCVREVKIKDARGKEIGKGATAKRDSYSGSFFFEKDGKKVYAEILQGYSIEIVNVADNVAQLKEEEDAKFSTNYEGGYFEKNDGFDRMKAVEVGKEYSKEYEQKLIWDNAAAFNVDPLLVQAIQEAKGEETQKGYFEEGILSSKIHQDAKNVHLMVREFERNYETVASDEKTGKFSDDFVYFLSQQYHDEEEIPVSNDKYLENISEFYLGKSLEKSTFETKHKAKYVDNYEADEKVKKEFQAKEAPKDSPESVSNVMNTGEVLSALGANGGISKLQNAKGTTVDLGRFKLQASGGEYMNRRARGSTTLEGLRGQAVSGLDKLLKATGAKLMITGGTETWIHTKREPSHHSGKKLDFSCSDGATRNALEKLTGLRGSGRKTINVDGQTMTFLRHEPDHFDVYFHPNGAESVANVQSGKKSPDLQETARKTEKVFNVNPEAFTKSNLELGRLNREMKEGETQSWSVLKTESVIP